MRIDVVTVVGANGTMGVNAAAVFALLGKAKVFMVCRSLEKAERAVLKVVKLCKTNAVLERLSVAEYSQLGECVAQSDLVFECVTEDFEIKANVTRDIAIDLKDGAVLCTGTSGLSVSKISGELPDEKRGRYIGVHLFNPSLNMTLCELISTKYTDVSVKERVRKYLESVLFRTVIETKDFPAFVANRIGFQFINEAMQLAEKYKERGGIDYIDAILGSFTGRTMAPLSTADFVGLDVHKSIVDNIYENTSDYAHDTFILPNFAKKLIKSGKLGRKTGVGLYKMLLSEKAEKHLLVYDIMNDKYREIREYKFPFAEKMKEQIKSADVKGAFRTLVSDESQEARICRRFLMRYIIYSWNVGEDASYGAEAAEKAMATGFGWCPPIALLELFKDTTDMQPLIKETLDDNKELIYAAALMVGYKKKSEYDYNKYFK